MSWVHESSSSKGCKSGFRSVCSHMRQCGCSKHKSCPFSKHWKLLFVKQQGTLNFSKQESRTLICSIQRPSVPMYHDTVPQLQQRKQTIQHRTSCVRGHLATPFQNVLLNLLCVILVQQMSSKPVSCNMFAHPSSLIGIMGASWRSPWQGWALEVFLPIIVCSCSQDWFLCPLSKVTGGADMAAAVSTTAADILASSAAATAHWSQHPTIYLHPLLFWHESGDQPRA